MRALLPAVFLLFLAVTTNTIAADANGYTARYEFPVGTPPACEQTIEPSDPWSAIDWNRRVICLAPGDHRGKGILVLPPGGGTASNKKWLRLAGSGTTHPVKLSHSQRAIVERLEAFDTRHWIIDRLTIYPSSLRGVLFRNCDYCIINRALIDGRHTSNSMLVRFREQPGTGVSEHSAIQNSVIRNTGKKANSDLTCLNFGGTDNRIVNNEIYNCAGDGIVFDLSSYPLKNKVENNDIYQTSEYLIGCDGRPGATCNCGEDGIDIKNNDTNDPSDQVEVIHNRFWGWRTTYESCGGTGGFGFAVNVGGSEPKRYVLIKDNIIAHVSNGVNMRSNTANWTVVGNLLYDVNHAHSPQDAPNNGDGEYSIAMRFGSTNGHRVYLNTVVDSKYGLFFNGDGANNDLRCNVFVNVPYITRTNPPAWGSGSIADYNAFYNAGSFLWGSGADNNFVHAGTNDARAESYCYSRKLLTGSEQACIPFVRPTSISPHYRGCNSEIASRLGIGTN